MDMYELEQLAIMREHMLVLNRTYSNVFLVACACAVIFSLNYMCDGHTFSGIASILSIVATLYSFLCIRRIKAFVFGIEDTINRNYYKALNR